MKDPHSPKVRAIAETLMKESAEQTDRDTGGDPWTPKERAFILQISIEAFLAGCRWWQNHGEDYDRGVEEAAKLADQLLEVYPEDVFTPITAAETKPLGAVCDRISAHMGRHVARLLASDIRALKEAHDE